MPLLRAVAAIQVGAQLLARNAGYPLNIDDAFGRAMTVPLADGRVCNAEFAGQGSDPAAFGRQIFAERKHVGNDRSSIRLQQGHLSPFVAACYSGGEMEDKVLETFGERLKAARIRKGLNQTAVSEFAGSRGHAMANAWENGYNFPELPALQATAHLLDVSIDYLVWGNDVANGIASRVRKIPPILRDSLVMRIHEEINRAEEAAKLLPPEMRASYVKDSDDRVQRFANANLRPRAPKTVGKKMAKRKGAKSG